MRATLGIWLFALASTFAMTHDCRADVIVRGPFGGLIVVPSSSSDVRVGPAGVAVNPTPLPVAPVPIAPVQPIPLPPPTPTPIMPAPPPPPAAPISPQEFARTFQPQPGTYQVTFLHPRTSQPVTVSFVLPPGTPRVYYVPGSLIFDYGRHEVEIRFQIGGGTRVIQR
jgi:hypothetical protein